jgi:phosphoglycolate phosphatase
MLLNFDYDGVITDSFDHFLEVCNLAQIAMGEGRPLTATDLATISNLTFPDVGKLIGLSASRVEKFTHKVIEIQDESGGKAKFFHGIVPVLQELSQKHKIVIITSNHAKKVQYDLCSHGIERAISKIMGCELNITKSERIVKAQKLFGKNGNDTFMIGDVVSDIREGKSAGVKTIAVSWGYQDAAFLNRESPDFMVDQPSQLLDIFA